MTTKELIVEYKNLKKTDPVAAYKFFIEKESDDRFTSLVRTGDNLVEFVNDFLEEGGDMLDKETFRQYLDKRFCER